MQTFPSSSQSASQSHAPPPQQLMFPSPSSFAPPHGVAQALPLVSSPPTDAEPKNSLIQYCQKAGLPMPVFRVVNEGSAHSPKFKSTVWVYGKSYASPNSFHQRRASEQDAARLALEQLPSTKKAISPSNLQKLVSQDKTLCKTIVYEFAAKMNLGKCIYETVPVKKLSFPMFVSSLVLNGTHYKGEASKSKKEAEQLAAHAALLSLLGDPAYAASLSEVIMPKLYVYAAFLGKDFERNSSVFNKAVKPTTVDNNMPMPLNQQGAAVEQSNSNNMPEKANSEAKAEKNGESQVMPDKQGDSELLGNEIAPGTVKSQAKMHEQDGHGVLAHEQGDSGVLGNEDAPQMVHSRDMMEEPVTNVVMVDEQGASGVLSNDSETLFTMVSCQEPATVTPKPSIEAQTSHHLEPSICQQISLPMESTPSAMMPCLVPVPKSSKNRRRNKKKKKKANNEIAQGMVNPQAKMQEQVGHGVLAHEQDNSGVSGNVNTQEMANSQAKMQEPVVHGVLAHERGDSGVLGDENTQELLDSQAKTQDQVGHGVLAHEPMPERESSQAKIEEPISHVVVAGEQGASGEVADDTETLLTMASCEEPVTVTPKPGIEAQPSHHETKLPHSEPSISQQIGLPNGSTPSAMILVPLPKTSKKRRRNKKNKANKRLQTEHNTDVPQVPSDQPGRCSVSQ